MAKKARGGRKSWQQLGREVDKASRRPMLTGVRDASKGPPRAKASVRVHGMERARERARKRGKAAPPADPMDREVPVKLGKEAIKIRENELAEKVLLRERLVAELRDTAKAKRGEIEALTARIHELAQVCTDGVDNVRQGDIRFGEAAAEASAILGKVAKGIEDVGVEDLPSEPHKFAGTGGSLGLCGKCGAPEDDAIHVLAPMATSGQAAAQAQP